MDENFAEGILLAQWFEDTLPTGSVRLQIARSELKDAEQASFSSPTWSPDLHSERLQPFVNALEAALREEGR